MQNISRALFGAAIFAIAAAGQYQSKVVIDGSGYFPVQIRLNDGSLLAVVRGGDAHVGVKGRLDLISSTNGGKSWSTPRIVVDEKFDDRNPALGQLKDGTVLLAYAIASGYDESGKKFLGGRSSRIFDGVYVKRSKDNGRTWTKPERSETIHQFYSPNGLVSPYGKIVQLGDGTVLMAVYFEFFDQRGFESHLFRSKDGGKTWGEPAVMGKGYNETGVAVLPNGDVLAALRSGKGMSISIARSTDGGRSFSAPEQITGDMEHPGDLIVLKDGRVLLSYGERNAPRGIRALISSDNGKTWNKEKAIVLANDAPNGDCGYPSSVQLPNGDIVTLYYQVDDATNAPASAKTKMIVWQAPK